jgi:PAS domain S-box-containing protein
MADDRTGKVRGKNAESAALSKRVRVLEGELARLRLERDEATAAFQVAQEEIDTLRRGERRLDLILESATEYAIFTLDLEGRITSWNTGARNILGWEKDEILGREGHVVFTPEDRAGGVLKAEMVKALGEGRAGDERWHVRRDGSRFWATGLLMPLRNGRVEGFLKILRDRTEERRAEEERESLRRRLEAEQAVFKAVVERLPSGLVVSEAPSGRHLIHNDQAIRLLGHDLADIADYPDYVQYGALHPDGTPYRAEEYPLVRTLLWGEVINQEEMIYRRGDGDITTLSVSTTPVRGPDGRITLGVTVFYDISDRKAIEEALRVAKDTAERASLAKSRFLAVASHDLRQPLQSLILFTAALNSHVHSQRGRQALAHLESGLGALKLLLDSLLDVSKLDARVVKPEISAFPIASLLGEISASYAPIAAGQGLEWWVEPCAGIVRSDRTLLGRIIRNLVENALRYTRQGFVRIHCQPVESRLRIVIEDSGVGIATEHLEKIFDEFHQIGNSARDRSQGLGLGLAIVRRVADLLGLHIEVRSRPGEGSTFAIELPLSGQEVAPPPAVEATCPNGQGRLLVVIDDDAMVLESLEAILTDWGYEVLAASSVEEAVVRLSELGRRPDLVISDYRLRDGQTGTDAIVAVRVLFDQSIPGVILTGETDSAFLRKAAEQRLGIVHKPVTPRQLCDVLDQQMTVGAPRGS